MSLPLEKCTLLLIRLLRFQPEVASHGKSSLPVLKMSASIRGNPKHVTSARKVYLTADSVIAFTTGSDVAEHLKKCFLQSVSNIARNRNVSCGLLTKPTCILDMMGKTIHSPVQPPETLQASRRTQHHQQQLEHTAMLGEIVEDVSR